MLSRLLRNRFFFIPRELRRLYQSDNGVFGYRCPQKREFQVPEDVLHSRNTQGNAYRLVEAYRKHGHKLASVNPISIKTKTSHLDVLDPSFYGLSPNDWVNSYGLINVAQANNKMSIADFDAKLRTIYCDFAVSAEFAYIESLEETEWLSQRFEHLTIQQTMCKDARRQIAELLIKAQAWENFMALKFPTVKRYGGEGAESILAFMWQLLEDSSKEGIERIVVGMPHRGRTALQTILLNMRPAKVFHKLSGESEFSSHFDAFCDVISHLHSSEELNVNGKVIRLSLLRCPSHLEAVNPVSMGKTRSKQQSLGDGAFSDDKVKRFGSSVVNVIFHGDAAFAGQGINQECLNMSYVPHFEIGGTVHLIVNNQLGFTTPGERGRSTEYASDLAKSIQAPVFHVNGDHPEMVAHVTRLALQYQREFRKNVFIDLNCFRRWGHNELDDPTFTNPSIYHIIHNRKSVPDLYAEKLSREDVMSLDECEEIRKSYMGFLNEELQSASDYKPQDSFLKEQWAGFINAPESISYWNTGLGYPLLSYIGNQSVAYPSNFNIHPHLLKTHIQARKKKLSNGTKIDWATAEALAVGSLLYQGHNVRISGQDVGRGTFSHRHFMLVDQQTNEMLIPLNNLEGGRGGKLEVAHSILSEEAVLGFEYGMAIDNPQNLIIWEAQFGDFANGAQIIIDNFIVSGETKWRDSNGLVVLLPHGYDGAASEHSSCRMERFLQLCDSKETAADGDNVNVHIVNPSTPAQYYHVLRRQMLRNFRKPLVVVAPKTLLRLSAATSTHQDFQPKTYFRNILGDDIANPLSVRRVILCSGKHFYNLIEERQAQGIKDTAIIRLESLSPFPLFELQEEIGKFKNATKFIWSQEEHRNLGAWTFIRPRFEHLMGKQILYCGRKEAPTSATGIGKVHKREAIEVVSKPFNL